MKQAIEKIISILLMTLILIGTLSTAIMINPSASRKDNNTSLRNNLMEEMNKETLDSASKLGSGHKQAIESQGVTATSKSEWDFNGTNGWSKFAYTNGSNTRLIVGVNNANPNSLTELEKIIAKHQAKVVDTASIKGAIIGEIVELPLVSVPAFAEEVRSVGSANYVEPNMKVQAQFVPDDPYWSMQWGPKKIESDWAWNTTMGSSSVLVAVVDTGIYYLHPDLAAHYVPLGFDWVNMDTDPRDDMGHGTHVAGIISAVTNNGVGISGLAQVRIMAEKVLDSTGSGYWDWVANGIINATNAGAKIISMSLGGYGDSELVHDAIKYAYESGVLLVAAAGNDNTNTKSYPAGYDEVVAVAATDQNDNKAGFSNWGDWIELAAPGVDIYSTVPWGYESWSGTSMACPQVSGVAALVWSRYPGKTRDWMRLWMQQTADDLGAPGFDIYYGYGRVNARKAIEQIPPAHELIASSWSTPEYVQPGTQGTINGTILNFGGSNETDVMTQLFANGTLVNSETVGNLAPGTSAAVSLDWIPTVSGLYNVTFYVVPLPSETNLENNALSKSIYVGSPVKAVVLHSAGNIRSEIIINWQALNTQWYLFGDTMVYIDYTTLNKDNVTYEDINATKADVLIISCAYDPVVGWQFSDSEIDAITRYVHEGHGLIVTAGTFYYQVPNNSKLASLFGLNETTTWSATSTDLLHLLNITHPIFDNVPNPLVFPLLGTALPYDGSWDSNELNGGTYLALGHYQEGAVVAYRGLAYISSWLEIIPPYYHHHLQVLYNAITWSRYQKPEHDLAVSLQCPPHLKTGHSVQINATVQNSGLNDETNVELFLLINGLEVGSLTVPTLKADQSKTFSYNWTPPEGTYNVTAYAPPVSGETESYNNVETARLNVSSLALIGFIETHGESLHSDNLKTFYQNLGHIVVTMRSTLTPAMLSDYDILIVGEDWSNTPWLSSEIAAVRNFIDSGKGFVAVGDELANSVRQLLSGYGITYTGAGGYAGPTSHFDHFHPIMEGVSYIYSSNPVNSLSAVAPGYWIANDVNNAHMLIAGAEVGGYVLCLSDDFAADLFSNDNQIMFENIVNWMLTKQHDLAVTLNAPTILLPGESFLLNATVKNRGSSNESDVELRLLINGTIVDNVIIPELLSRKSYSLGYMWNPTAEGSYNVTAYAPPMPSEGYTRNNVASASVSVIYTVARVAVLNSIEIPPYFDGGLNNNYQLLVDALNAHGFHAEAITNEQIIAGGLNSFDVFVMVDNVPSVAAVPFAVSFWSSKGGIVAFDSSICFLCYAGILPPESAGHSGYYTYWDYDTRTQAKISMSHPITEGYSVGQVITGTSGDAEYKVDALGGTSVFPYFTMLVEDSTRPNRAYVSAYEPPFEGKVVHIWDQSHWGNPNLQLMILNAMEWAKTPRYEHDLAVRLDAPASMGLGNLNWVNATVTNHGSNKETDVTLQLMINGAVVDSESIPELSVGASYMIRYPWTPTVVGTCNITAYAPPIPSEELTTNNVATKLVRVTPMYTLTIAVAAGGTTSPIPGNYSYEAGSVVTVTAIPWTGCYLDHWELDGHNVGALNPMRITMDRNHSLGAVFSGSLPISGAVGITGFKLVFQEIMNNSFGSPMTVDYYWDFTVDKWSGSGWVTTITDSSVHVMGYEMPASTTTTLPSYVFTLNPSTIQWGNWLRIRFTFHWTFYGTNHSIDYVTKLHVHPADVIGGELAFPYLGSNGIVDISDGAMVGINWQGVIPFADLRADINGDGVVNISDAAVIGLNWQKTWANTPTP